MSSYASGKNAFGFCDRTGFRYPLKDLVPQIQNGRPNGLLVGRDVVDEDQPQLQLGKLRTLDPQSLRDPRPDTGQAESRRMYAFDPIGGGNTALGSRTVGLDMTAELGKITVSTD
jgi:hypothetical protein